MTRPKKIGKRALYLNSLAGDKMQVRVKQMREYAAQGKTIPDMMTLMGMDDRYLRELAKRHKIDVPRVTTKTSIADAYKVERRAKPSPVDVDPIQPPFYMKDPFLTLRQRDHSVFLTRAGYRLNGAPVTEAAVIAAANRIRMAQCKPLYELPQQQEAA